MKRTLFYVLLAVCLFVSCDKGGGDTPSPEPTPGGDGYNVGDVLHDWEKGCLDFHGISTGRGESWLLIMPDGTSVLIDAGETATSSTSVPQRPNEAMTPSYTIGRYLQKFLPATGETKLDYMFLTHFHQDHMGTASLAKKTDNYKHMGMAAVYDMVPCKKLIDRGWPTYGSNPKIGYYNITSSGSTSTDTPEWIKFAKYINEKQDVPVEMFNVGASDQFAMTKGGGYDCVVKNIAANGYYLTPTGGVNTQAVDGENPCSCGIHVRYGKFDLITCGDCVSAPQNRVAEYAIGVVPSKKLEVFKAHHHLNNNSWGSGMQKDDFSPKITLCERFFSYTSEHIGTLSTAISKSTYVFLTNAHPDSVTEYPDVFSKVKGYDGHFVVRVFSNGEFYIFKLDDTNYQYKITAKYGPYTCN